MGETPPRPDSNEKPGETCATCGVVLRIGVFFDGTLNSEANTAARLQKGDKRKGSYENDYSNIVELKNVYFTGEKTDKGETYIYRKIYIEGVGTEDEKDDATIFGAGLDYFSTSMKAKHKKACDLEYKLATELDKARHVKRVEVDIFGFSRGAATARHHANEIRQYSAIHDQNGAKFNRPTEIEFVGLFDTVGSHGVWSTSPTNSGLKLTVDDGLVKHEIYQIVSLSDKRQHFPSDSIRSDSASSLQLQEHVITEGKRKEEFMWGAHADQGGGHIPNSTDNVEISGPFSTPDAAEADLAKQREDLAARNYPTQYLQVVKIVTILANRMQAGKHIDQYYVYYIHKNIDNKLSNRALVRMHKEAVGKTVPFLPLPAADTTVPDNVSEAQHNSTNQNSISNQAPAGGRVVYPNQ